MHAKKEIQVTIDSIQPVDGNGDGNKEKLPVEKKSKMKKQNKGNRTRLLCMLFLTFGYFVVEIVVGYMTNSVALVADSFHMLSDVISLIIAYVAVRMSPKKWTQNTFGWARAEVLGALVNAVFLVALCFTIVVDSLKRFIKVEDIENPKLILIVGTVGLVVNLIGLVIFREHGHSHGGGGGHGHGHSHGGHGHSHAKGGEGGGHSHKGHHSHQTPARDLSVSALEYEDKGKSVDLVNWSILKTADTAPCENSEGSPPESQEKMKSSSANQMNMHGVYLHVMADALGSVIVIISALVIWLTEWNLKMYVDPLLSLIMVILIICSVWPLFVESAMVLLQTVPTHIQIDELKTKLLSKVSGAYEVHEFHIWQLSGNRIIASAHILCNRQEDFMRIGEEVKEFFHNEGIHSTTIQLEWASQAQNPLGQQGPGEDNSDSDGIGDGDSDTRSDCFLTCPFDDEDAECVNNSCCGVQKKKISVINSSSTNAANITAAELPVTSTSQANFAFVESDDENVIQGSKLKSEL